jgi:hypothetical protein
MKKSLGILAFLFSFSALANQPQFSNLSKSDVEDVSKEFGANFSHTSVAAPETDGAWGIEFGVSGGQTSSSKFSDVVEASGGKGSDFKNIYHVGVMGRVHLPGEIFLEATMLPEQKISSVKIKSSSFGIGWNFGRFIGLPLDLAVGLDRGNGDVSFHQDQDLTTSPVTPAADIKLQTTTTNYWLGVSKSFWVFTPYAKVGMSKIIGDLDASTPGIFGYGAGKQNESVNLNGSYLALGANIQLLIVKLGMEASQIQQVKRLSAKLSFDF